MTTQSIERLFKSYVAAFNSYDLNVVVACHQFPCTLHTPDKVALINTIDDCREEFSNIFMQLKQGDTANIIAKKASYMSVKDDLLLVCIDWEFIDSQGQIFTDFCAYYHICVSRCTEQRLAIVNVVSHELSNSLTLANNLSISG